MSRTAGETLESISLRPYASDIAYLRRVFPGGGYQVKLRDLIRAYVVQLRAEGEETLQELERMYPNGK